MCERIIARSITDKASIDLYRLMTLKGGLKLEIAGMKKHGRSTYSIIKDELGFKGTKQRVLEQLEAEIKSRHEKGDSKGFKVIKSEDLP